MTTRDSLLPQPDPIPAAGDVWLEVIAHLAAGAVRYIIAKRSSNAR